MNQFPHRKKPHAPAAALVWAVVCGLAVLVTSHAQDLPRPSSSRARDGGGSFSRPYNLKLGPIAFTANAGVGVEFVDNLNLSATDKTGDIILRPTVGFSAVWQVTRLNNLEFRTSLGYSKYLSNSDLDSQSVLIAPDSALKFNLYIGDVKIVFSDQFGFDDEPIGAGGVSNVAKLSRFTNTIGVNALWDLNDVIWSAGYSHYNLFTTGGAATTEGSVNDNLSILDRASDQFSTSVFLKLDPTLGFGLEGTAAYTSYPNNSDSGSSVYSLGPFIDFQLTAYTRFILSGGYQLYSSENGGGGVDAGQFGGTTGIPGIIGFGIQPQRSGSSQSDQSDGNGYYFTLAITHRLNRFYSDRLSVGREFQTGVLGDRSETFFASYSSTLQLTRRLTVSSSVSYNRSTQTSQFSRSFNGATLPDYDTLAIGFGTGFQLTRKLNVAVTYQFLTRTAASGGQDFTQNRLALQFGYQF